MKVLILVDKPNWAYDSIAKSIKKYNHREDVFLDIEHIKSNISRIKNIYKKYDSVFVMGWQNHENISFIPKKLCITGIHSYHSWDKKQSTPDKDSIPPKSLINHLSEFKAVNAVSERLYSLFKKNGLSSVCLTPNGVDTEIFKCVNRPPVHDFLIVGYSGSKSHDWRKGISEFIIPSAKKCNVKLKLAMLSTNDYVSLDKMYQFYNEIDCYICASSSEGMSLSVLESCSCGRPVIGTKVSGNTEIINDGINGFLVDRTVKDICDKIEKLKDRKVLQDMSICVERDMKEKWDWAIRSRAWIDFIYRN